MAITAPPLVHTVRSPSWALNGEVRKRRSFSDNFEGAAFRPMLCWNCFPNPRRRVECFPFGAAPPPPVARSFLPGLPRTAPWDVAHV